MKNMKKRLIVLSVLVSFLAVGLWTAPPAAAQVTTAMVEGTVTDSSQAVLPGVTVTITNVDMGLARTAVTDGRGRYRAPNLKVGNYEFQVELDGFGTLLRRGIVLTVGSQVVIDFTLDVGTVAERIVVIAEAPLVDTKTSTLSQTTDGTTMRELPINGRNFLRLLLLDAGTVPVTYRKEITKGMGLQLALNGARPTMTGYLLDGSNIQTSQNFRAPGGASGVLLGVDAIREFEVLSNAFSAEFGNAAGGIVNAVTRSGTNEFHGSGFEFHRNDALDAKNFFDDEMPPLTRNQFGGTIGGPLVRDRTFFFGNYEGVREDRGLTSEMLVPSAETRARDDIDPLVVPFLALWPESNGEEFPDGTAAFTFSETYPTSEDFFVVKVDQVVGGEDQIFFRYSFNDSRTIGPKGTDTNSNFGVEANTRAQYFTTEYNKVINPSSLNMFRFSFNRSFREGQDALLQDVDPSLQFVPGVFGNLRVPGLTRPGTDGKYPREATLDVLEVHDNVSLIRGSHDMKMGFMWSRFHDRSITNSRLGGEYQFRSLSRFLRLDIRRLRLPGIGTDNLRNWRSSVFGMFFQDSVQVTRRLTLNLGLRYEFITVPTERDGKVSNLRDPLNDTMLTVGDPLFENPSLKNYAPRVGFAWDPAGDGKTSIRGGFGIYHEQLHLGHIASTGRNLPFSFNSNFNRPCCFPDAREGAEKTPPRLRAPSPDPIQFEAEQPALYHLNLSVERQVLPQTMVSLAYAGSRGTHLQRLVEFNNVEPIILPDGRPFHPEDAERRNPVFDTIDQKLMDGNSFYHSGQIKVSRPMSKGLLFKGSYTFSKSIDDSSNGNGASDYTYPSEVSNSFGTAWRGLSEFHIGHSLSLHAVYEIPGAAQGSGLAAGLLGGWQIGGIVNVRSGAPFPIKIVADQARTQGKDDTQMPDLVPGFSNNPIEGVTAGCEGVEAGQKLGGSDLYFDPCAFELSDPGFFGNLGRNTTIGPGLATMDLSLSKRVRFSNEALNLQLRLEIFNLFNRANFENPVDNVFAWSEDGRIGSAGRLDATTTTARQIQLGLKLQF